MWRNYRRRRTSTLANAAGTHYWLPVQLSLLITRTPNLLGRFLQLLVACLGSGRGHLAAIAGDLPKRPQAWGWRESSVGIGNSARGEWRAQGQRLGWVADDDIYLEPDAAFAAVQEMGNQVGEPLTILSKTLNKRLVERGLLRSQDKERNRHTVRCTIEGRAALSQVHQVYACLKPYEQRELVRLVLHRAEVHVRELVLEINGAVGQAITPAMVNNGGVVRQTQDWLPELDSNQQHAG